MRSALIIVADLHCGSHAGLCPPSGYALENGGCYKPNSGQLYTWLAWEHFWTRFVPGATQGCTTLGLAINGDIVEGVHHRLSNIISTDWETQEMAGLKVINSITKLWPACQDIPKFVVRGTETHGDTNDASEERIAKTIKAEPNAIGEYSRWQWWINIKNSVVQLVHHISLGKNALRNEIELACKEAGKNGFAMPDVMVRSHAHRFDVLPVSRANGNRITALVTPGWQLRTPYMERMDRITLPQIGGVVLVFEENKSCSYWEKIYQLPQPQIYQMPTVSLQCKDLAMKN